MFFRNQIQLRSQARYLFVSEVNFNAKRCKFELQLAVVAATAV